MATVSTGRLDASTLIYGLRAALDPRLSPDGERIVYALAQADREADAGRSRLMVQTSAGGDPSPLTDGGHLDLGAVWSPDGARIAFVSDRSGRAGIHLIDAAGGTAELLIEHDTPISTDLQWSADGSRIAYTALVDPTGMAASSPPVRVTSRTDYKQDVRGYLGEARTQVFVLDVGARRSRQLTEGATDFNYPAWSPDGRWIAARQVKDIIKGRLAVIEVESGAQRLVGAAEGSIGVWAWSPTGDRILIAADPLQSAQLDLYVYNLETGNLGALTDDLQVQPDQGYPNLAPPSPPLWLDDRRVLLHAFRGGTSGLFQVDVETGAVEKLANFNAVHSGFSADSARRRLVQVRSSFDEVSELFLHDLETSRSKVLSRHNSEVLGALRLPEPEHFEIERGGLKIESWLLKPPGFEPTRKYPLILDVHGGPHGHHGPSFGSLQQSYAAAGFLVLFSNPRGSTSYGRSFAAAVQKHWGEEDFLDLMAVVDEVLSRGYVDPDRTGIYGYSYGGYMTSWTIGQTDRFRAAVCGAPCYDLQSMYGTSDIAPRWAPIQWGGPPHENRDWYRDHSPSTRGYTATTPTLIIHGEADHRCPIGQGEQLFIDLKIAGCEVEFARYPDCSHLFMRNGRPSQREDVIRRATDWFTRHLGAEPG